MRKIEGILTEELKNFYGSANSEDEDAFPVTTYRQLIEQIAKLSYLNKDYLLFYRGQGRDYKNKAGSSTFYPSIYRGDYLPQNELHYRFDVLNEACKSLRKAFLDKKVEGYSDLIRKKYIQWSILQHYEVCETPLLDLSHSVRVAASFAQLGTGDKYCYVYVFGLPYITNRISINSEHDIVNIRLLSICPPNALRPYFQEGYLAGTEDITTDYESKSELDFNNRLIAKFMIPSKQPFWGRGFSAIPKTVLFPRADQVEKLCGRIHIRVKEGILPGQLGEFMKEWTTLENRILEKARTRDNRVYSTRVAIDQLASNRKISKDNASVLHDIRRFRNLVVHEPKKITSSELETYLQKIYHIFVVV